MKAVVDYSLIIPVLIGGLLSLLGSYLAVRYGAKKALEKEYLLRSLEIMEKMKLRENLYDVLWEETSKIKELKDLSLQYVNNFCDVIEKIMETKKLMLYCPLSDEINGLYRILVNLDLESEKERKRAYKKIRQFKNHIETILTYITYSPKKFGRGKRVKKWLMGN